MPVIITRGALSARGAGTFSLIPPPPPPPPPPPGPPPPPPPPGPVLQTVTFTSSGSWTAPAGVSNLVALYIAGGQYYRSEGQWIRGARFLFNFAPGGTEAGNPSSYWTYAGVNNYVDSLLANLNSSTGERTISFVIINNYYNYSTGGFYNDYDDSGSFQTRGEVLLASGPSDNRTNEIVYPNQSWIISYETYYPPQDNYGSPSSAFGYTVPGGDKTNPNPDASYSNIPVTPGQTYSIQVGSTNGVVQFQFYQS